MPGIKEIKTRIKSIGSTRKITRAMQMVSAAKMRKAQTATLNSRTYSGLAWELINSLSSVIPASEPESRTTSDWIPDQVRDDKEAMTSLLRVHPNAKKIGVIILSSNRGLVGSLNANLFGKLREIENADNAPMLNKSDGSFETLVEIVTYGKYAKNMSVRLNKNVVADFPKIDKTITTEDIYPIAQYITQAYATGQYKKIVILYNHFVSTLTQKPTVKQLLPFVSSSPLVPPHALGRENPDYLFEPDPGKVLEHLIPRIIESQIYQTILESDASEHSARMVMMKNATEAAGDLISDLTLTYNQLRQNKITTELAEITAGKIALE